MRAVVLMTALPPTLGHIALVKFAHSYVQERCWAGGFTPEEVVVVVASRPQEPVPGELRARWLAESLEMEGVHGVRVVCMEGEEGDPQRPDPSLADDGLFWAFWAQVLSEAVDCAVVGGMGPQDVLVSSETYGPRLARELGVEHVWYDPDRLIQGSRATDVRAHPIRFAHHLAPAARRDLRVTVTLFGAESVGKTTTARWLGGHFRARVVPEWARTYLEREPDPAPTPERMARIGWGQAAAQDVPVTDTRLLVVRDTDLLSTIGYHRVLGTEPPASLLEAFERSRADHYILLSSDADYAPDPLRYGGTVRETTDAFWRLLLQEFGCSYTEVWATGPDRLERARSAVLRTVFASSPLWRHERD